jgi:signal recognition particle receptor subunit beta
MAFASSPDSTMLTSAKIVIAGGFGVGKTTCVRSISEITPINTEAWMTAASEPVDRLDPGIDKTTTTVAMDFGRLTIGSDLVLYLFGTPGQARFWPMWDDLSRGAVGALVLVDTRRLDTSFAAVNYFEQDSDLPFVVLSMPGSSRSTGSLAAVIQASVLIGVISEMDRTQVVSTCSTAC